MSWKEELPEKVRGWDEVKNSETAEQFFDQIANHRSALGQSIRIPGEDAAPEVKAAFLDKIQTKVPNLLHLPDGATDEDYARVYKALGRPESADKYDAPQIEGVELQAETLNLYRENALKADLTNTQFKKLLEGVVELETSKATEAKTAAETAMANLKSEWGQAFTEKQLLAENVRKQYFPFVPPEGVGAETLKALAEIGAQLGNESNALNTTNGQQQGAITPAEAKMKISEMLNNKQHPYWHPRDPGHEFARKRMRELNLFAA